MLAVTRKNHVFTDKFFSISNSSISKKKTASRATKGRAKINLEYAEARTPTSSIIFF